jgi:hypothetical protein
MCVSSVAWLTGPTGRHRVTGLDRRGFLGIVGAAGVAALVPLADLSPGALSADERTMILQVARTGAVFPIAFPDFGEPGPASTRATAARLREAASRSSPARLALARAGADALIARGLLNQPQARLLDGLGQQAGVTAAKPGLTATVALAIATVSRHFDPGSDEAALLWTRGLQIMHQRGLLAGKEA